jgi:hypothetical protein
MAIHSFLRESHTASQEWQTVDPVLSFGPLAENG